MIVFEGLDGSGKTTQVNLLKQFLEDFEQQNLFAHKDYHYVIYDFPRYYENFWGSMVGRMMNKEFGTKIDPYLRSPFYMLDQADAGKSMRKNLAEGKIVICNRYLSSSMIFQTALVRGTKAKAEFVKWLEDAAYINLNMVKPDIVLCLYVDPMLSQDLITKKDTREYVKGKKKDLNEENLKLQVNAGKEMVNFCKQRKNWKLIDCMDGKNIKKPEEINQMILEVLKSYLQ